MCRSTERQGRLTALREECGVFGIYGENEIAPVQAVCLGLYALQHRGQESCGIAVSDMGVMDCYKGIGLVNEVFAADRAEQIHGQMAIGHVRYGKESTNLPQACQPLLLRYAKGRLALAFNGSLTNSEQLQDSLAQTGAMFQNAFDAEVIAQVITKERVQSGSIEQAVLRAMHSFRGAYCILAMSPRKIVAARDPYGIRPLCIGKLGGSYLVASESCAFDAVHAQFVRDVRPGEVVVLDENGLHSLTENCPEKDQRRICIFEYIYFARPDSVIDGISVHASRVKAGALLAKQYPANADIVIPVPDSSIDAALGYSYESGIAYEVGFLRNNYIGRTFIMPTQGERRQSVDRKLSVIGSSVYGKRIVMVDDSIVRGSTCQNIIRNLKKAGAKEVHVRISSPTLHWPCFYGTDIPTKEELTSNRNSVEELCRYLGADSLGFLKKESLCDLVDSQTRCYCDACFTGHYPVE